MADSGNKSIGGMHCTQPPDAQSLLARAQQYLAAGRIDETVSTYRGLLLQQPGHADAHFLLGALLARKGDLPGAKEHMGQAVKLRPESADFQHGLGLLNMRMQSLPEAVDCFRKAVAARPDLAVAHNNLGTALRRSGDLQGALVCWRTAFRLKRSLEAPPSDLETFTVVSRTKLRHDIEQLRHLRARDLLPQSFDGTIAAYEKVLASLPDGSNAPHSSAWAVSIAR